MKVFSSECIFDYSWEEVSTANWLKYCPWNDKSPHVVAVDTLSRSVEPLTGRLRTERLITCTQSAPGWVLALLGGNPTSHVHETSYVDPIAKRVTMVSHNLSWSNILTVRETVVYQPILPDSMTSDGRAEKSEPERTQFKQEAQVTALCGGWQKIKSKIEDATVERFSENAKRGREGFETVLEMSRRVFGQEKERQKQENQDP